MVNIWYLLAMTFDLVWYQYHFFTWLCNWTTGASGSFNLVPSFFAAPLIFFYIETSDAMIQYNVT